MTDQSYDYKPTYKLSVRLKASLSDNEKRAVEKIKQYIADQTRPFHAFLIRRWAPSLYLRVAHLVDSLYVTRKTCYRFEKHLCAYLLDCAEPKQCVQCGSLFFGGRGSCTKSCVVTGQWSNPDTAKNHLKAFEQYEGGHPMRDPKVMQRIRDKERERTGHDWHTQRPEQQKIRRKLSMERYGVPHPIQDPEIFRRQQAALHCTKRVRIQGKYYVLRGYEPQVARDYLGLFPKARFLENSVSIKYDEITSRGDPCHYNPDFELKLPNEHLLVEVKCLHTLKDDWDINLKKFKAANRYAEKNGKVFVLVIHEPRVGSLGIRNPTVEKIQRLVNKVKKEKYHG